MDSLRGSLYGTLRRIQISSLGQLYAELIQAVIDPDDLGMPPEYQTVAGWRQGLPQGDRSWVDTIITAAYLTPGIGQNVDAVVGDAGTASLGSFVFGGGTEVLEAPSAYVFALADLLYSAINDDQSVPKIAAMPDAGTGTNPVPESSSAEIPPPTIAEEPTMDSEIPERSGLSPIQGAQPINPGDEQDAAFSIGDIFGGTQRGCRPTDWALAAPGTSRQALIAMAASGGADGDAAPAKARYIAQIAVPAQFQGANWAWSENGTDWRVHRAGAFDRCTDPAVSVAQLVPGSSFAISGNGAAPGAPAGPGAGGGQTAGGAGLSALLGLAPVSPNTYTIRRCPPRMRLAIDGMCYLAAALPRALWMNKSKKAPVSWQKAQHINKGFAAAKSIQDYGKRATSKARELVPPTRRRRTTTKAK